MRLLSVASVTVLALAFMAHVSADIAIVVRADSKASSLTRNEAINIFMGRYRKLSDGSTAIPVDLEPVKQRFYQALVQKDLAEINAYWARLVFSGQASPPLQLHSNEDIVDLVANNRGAIAYVDTDAVTADMRVLLTLPEDVQ